MRLLVLLEQARPTGLVRQLVELLHGLSRRSVESTLVSLVRDGTDVAPLGELLARRGLSHVVVRERWPFDVAVLGRLRRIAGDLRPDLLQTHGYKSAACALALRRKLRVPWLAFYHGRTSTDWKVRAYHAFERLALSRADAVATVAPGVAGHLRRRDRDRLRIVPNGIIPLPPAGRDRDRVRQELGFAASDLVVGFVGRLSQEKGPDVFLETLELLRGGDDDVRGLVVGEGPMLEDLRGASWGEGTDEVRFVGRVDDVASMYGAMDVVVISSRSEVFPNVLIEGVESLRPVASTPVGGVPAVARELATVVVADEVDAAALARAVRRVTSLASEAELQAARSRFRADYSQDRRVSMALELYGEILGA